MNPLFAKLLATENITVQRASARTASFDVNNRVLTIPNWKDMSSNIEDMLIGHEVGHAIWTTPDMLKSNSVPFSYVNVVEDVRIERLMKIKYPGIRKTMVNGYKELNDKDFFGVKTIDVTKLNLIDRINMWFKVGISSGVMFSDEEKTFVERCMKTETSVDVLKLSEDIFLFSKEQNQKDEEEEPSDVSDDSNVGESDTQESDSNDDGEEESDCEENKGESDYLESITDRSFNDKLTEQLDVEVIFNYYTLFNNYDDSVIVPYTKIIEMSSFVDNYLNNDMYQQFKNNTDKSVSYLVKEFELKKSADNFKRTNVSKTGSLDTKKLWSYKVNDDIFKKITVAKDGKNHGMIFLLDWSGSMSNVINDVAEQVIQLASFCYRAQIPFQVFAFTNRMPSVKFKQPISSSEKVFTGEKRMSLLEIFSSKMKPTEFSLMCKRFKHTQEFQCSNANLGLGSTPLNEALLFLTDYMGKFKKINNIQKLSFISMTDGEGSLLNFRNREYSYHKKNIDIVLDPVTKKEYNTKEVYFSPGQTSILLNVIKERYDASMVSFYICSRIKEVYHALYNNNIRHYFDRIDTIKRQILENKYALITESGYDELYIILSKSMKMEDKTLVIDNNKSAHTIAKTFTKVLKDNRTNRVLLSKFISLIA